MLNMEWILPQADWLMQLLAVGFFALGMAGHPCCCGGGVGNCGCAVVPDTITVVIAGVTNGAGCTDCDTIINGTYIVDIDPDTCMGQVENIGPDCFDYGADPENFWVLVQIEDIGGPSFRYDVKITDGDAPESFRRTDTIGGDDCCAVEDEPANEYFGPVKDCDWSGATVETTGNCA